MNNAGVEAPYILMPHSIGGVYASYWISKYPDEIEAIVFLDGGDHAIYEQRPEECGDIDLEFINGLDVD